MKVAQVLKDISRIMEVALKMDKVKLWLIGIIVILLLAVAWLAASPVQPLAQTQTVTTTATITKTEASLSTSISTTSTTSVSTSTVSTTVKAGTVTVTTTATTTIRTSGASWEVYFSPKGGAAKHVISWLDKSNSSVCAAIYSFTSDDISAAFIRMKQRGVNITISMDNEQLNVQGGEYLTLKNASIPVRVDRRSGLLHDKYIVIDGKVVITGSYNWSANAEDTNRENLIILQDPALTSLYLQNCQDIWRASTP